MCTSPNYIMWSGKYALESKQKVVCFEEEKEDMVLLPIDYGVGINYGRLRPKFDFLGKRKYEDMINTKSPWIQVPCGQCLECRIQQSRAWADRLILHSKKYEHNYFITLTYDDVHLPGVSLDPDDFTKFMKRLRKHFPDNKISYFMSGEYGDTSRRPHFHAIIFNLPLDDLTKDFCQYDNESKRLIHKTRYEVDDLMYSPLIHKVWQYKGEISVGKVTFDSCQYVAGYVTKKYNKDNQEFYKKMNIIPEYARMSRNPGIAKDFFDDNDDWLLFQGDMIVPGRGQAHISMTPRYFDKLFIKKYGEDVFQEIRDKRINQRFNKRNKNCHEALDLDTTYSHRNYKLTKRQKLRDQI